jgi:pyridoxamine 5'-phosphate oxidase family protein
MSPSRTPEPTYLQRERRPGRLATADPDGTPRVTPVSAWTVGPDSGVIEIVGYRNLTATKIFRDAARTGRAAVITNDVHEPWRLRAGEIRGCAEAIEAPAPVIRIHPDSQPPGGTCRGWHRPSDRCGVSGSRSSSLALLQFIFDRALTSLPAA